ncbi:hypothetical protein SPBR_08247 [Sporothrix brasiliensis 5110]|uniref:Uncharacterized protein n=1 Tax=Sporothrix brasiliensis 5110 TaxID=1398154 RepID=A0A0C2IJ13_9PEZI|nr:uncharacterized protein SPBR_08247 [Sporothrix brasiliensis 5110]KIH86980.1 hypothetical protein SPBR_08247 [Sporothrix brasiliensis 5110]
MSVFSFLHRLVCRKCKNTTGSHRVKRRLKRLPRLEQEQDEWRPSWMHETCDLEFSNENDGIDDGSLVVELDARPPSSSDPPTLPVVPASPPVLGIGIQTRTAGTTNRYSLSRSSSSPTLTVSSSRSSLTRMPAVHNLRLRSSSSSVSGAESSPPQLRLSWEHAPPSPLISEPKYCRSPKFVPTVFVDVKPLTVLSKERRYPLLTLDADSDETESNDESISPTSSVWSPVTERPLPHLLGDFQPVKPTPRVGVNFTRNNRISPLAARRDSGGNFGNRNCTNAANTNVSSGPRYIPASKTVVTPRLRPSVQRSPLQQTLPVLRVTAPFDESLGTSYRPPQKLIHRKSVLASSSVSETPTAPIKAELSNGTIRPYDQTHSRRHAQQVMSLTLLSSSSSHPLSPDSVAPHMLRLIPYNSRQGYSMLQTLRRLLVVPVDWSAAQTLLFVLQRPAVRRLALPFHLSSSPSPTDWKHFQDLLGVARCNSLGWYGIMQTIEGPMRYHTAREHSHQSLRTNFHDVPSALAPCSNPRALSGNTRFSVAECDLVARWLASGEPLFTRQTTLPMVLMRKSRQPLLRSSPSRMRLQRLQQQARGRTPLSPLTSSSVHTRDLKEHNDPAIRYDIARNPRCRHHQLWTGAGKSRLSVACLAEY